MSHKSNDELLEQARIMCEYWTGTMHERIMLRDIEANDLEALAYHVNEARKQQAIEEDAYITDFPLMGPALFGDETADTY